MTSPRTLKNFQGAVTMSSAQDGIGEKASLTVYLAGLMDSENLPDSLIGWRQKVTNDLTRLGEVLEVDFQMYNPFGDGDRERIGQSDMVIVGWRNGIDSVRTINEILYARHLFNVPVTLLLMDERYQVSLWLYRLTKTLEIPIYYGWDLLYRDLAAQLPLLWQAKLQKTRPVRFLASLDVDAYSEVKKEPLILRCDEQHGTIVRPNIIINLGPPGSGKSTQSKFLADQTDLNIAHIETSALIKEAFDGCADHPDAVIEFEGTVYPVAAQKAIYYSGELNDMGFVLGLIRQKLASLPASCLGVTFSGSPRRLREAELLMPMLEDSFPQARVTVFEFVLPKDKDATVELIFARALKRERPEGFDTPEKMAQRLVWYKDKAWPVVGWLEQRGYKVFRIDAAALEQEVSAAMLNHLASWSSF